MGITTLPNDIFLLIVALLSPSDLIVSRRVSKAFNAAFTASSLNRHELTSRFPRVRELRFVSDFDDVDWSRMFVQVAARYHYLQSG